MSQATLALFLAVAACCFPNILALPASENPPPKRAVNCLAPNAPYDESCWSTLDLTNWLNNWNKTVPKCHGSDDGSKCCGPSNQPNEPWTTCFLRLSLGDADYDCTELNQKACSLEGFKLDSSVNGSSVAQTRYIIRNIYGKYHNVSPAIHSLQPSALCSTPNDT